MLVIARKVGQTLQIGDSIEITVSAIRGDQVRLAIKAPREVSVLRKEVIRQVEQGNAAAVDSVEGLMELIAAEGEPGSGSPARPVPVQPASGAAERGSGEASEVPE
jgi:carbon storage regulator